MMNTSSRITSDQGVVLMQYLARALFAGLAVMYFHHADHFFFTLPKATPWLLFCAYIGIQLLLLIWRPVNADAFASALDLLTLGIVLLLDAGDPPPTMALLFIAVLSNGLLHGLKRFLIMLIGRRSCWPLSCPSGSAMPVLLRLLPACFWWRHSAPACSTSA